MFSDPRALVFVVGALAIAALVTWTAARLVGRRMAKRHPVLARLVTAITAPAIALACGIALFLIDPAAYLGVDWPAMGLVGTILISQIMLVATIPTTWFALRRQRAAGSDAAIPPTIRTTVTMTRDSVCMADDVDAPHEETFVVSATDTLAGVAATISSSSYLPMPSDAWGWTIEAGGAVVAIRPGLICHRVATLQGNPAAVMARDHSTLLALYVRPGSPWRDVAITP